MNAVPAWRTINTPERRLAPDAALIEAIRARFVVEPEIDRVMTRKMQLRSGPAYTAVALDTLVEGTTALIARHIGGDFSIRAPRWLQGGASKLQMAFDLDWRGPDGGERRVTPMVLRMEPPAAIVETSRAREFEVLGLVGEYVPAPRAFWVDPDGSCLPYPALIYEFCPGVTKPTTKPSQTVSGIGTNLGPELRPKVAGHFIANLAALHTIPTDRLHTLKHFQVPDIGNSQGIALQIDGWRRIWEEDKPEDFPFINVIYRWLRDNRPVLDHASVVHGDYRVGNILFDEEDGRFHAILDWELAVIGDRHQDLSWATGTHFGHFAEDGATFLACGLLPAEAMFERYEKVSGLTVDPDRIKFYRVFNDFCSMITMLGTAPRIAAGGKTHQDVVVAYLAMIGHAISGKVLSIMEEITR